ncbi:OprO/OprP family phosphate-selective porin [Zavarzinella formosa]|uniref:OprO/OprP family phosphate-selective porin n=1 Tax=Zavarzinella formosa TaxID=360055 RepID=UPI0012FC490F|nr:porin [Zavarzinella formosa]
MIRLGFLSLLLAVLAVCSGTPVGAQEREPTAPASLQSEIDELKRRTASLENQLQETKQAAEQSWDTRFEELIRSSKEGFVRTSLDGNSTIRFGGRVQLDAGWFETPHGVQDRFSAPFVDGVVLRRAVLETDGTLWKYFDYSFNADVSRSSDLRSPSQDPDATVYITNAWLAVTDLFVPGTLKAGHQIQPLLFSAAGSNNFLSFMERPAVYDGLNDDFSYETGLSYRYSTLNDRLTGFVGVFKPGTRLGGFGVGNGEYALTGRVHGFPIYDEAEQQWLYVGVAGSYRTLADSQNRIFTRPLVRTGTRFQNPHVIDTGDFFSSSANQLASIGSYAALGPLAFGGEYLASLQNNAYATGLPGTPGSQSLGNLFFSGFYLEALCFLTPGDHRPASLINGGFDRVKPVSPVGPDHEKGNGFGWGAWEIGLRYDRFDANTGNVRWGRMDSVSAGVNWYLNANVRWMTNYVFTQLDGGGAGNVPIHAFGTRIGFDF